MACATPIVAADVAPVREIVGKETCIFVDFFDISALSEAIETMIRRPASVQQIRMNARKRATRMFDFQKTSWPRLLKLVERYKV
jgi:glycosyltransferase involved in cell wall biosynthesis